VWFERVAAAVVGLLGCITEIGFGFFVVGNLRFSQLRGLVLSFFTPRVYMSGIPTF